MEKSLAPFFTADRTKRLDSMQPEQRRIVEEEAKASGNPDQFIDNILVSKWLSQRTGKDEAFVDENLEELVKVYFGESANASSAYSNIAAHYQEWTNALDEARALAEVKRRAEGAKYASQSTAYKVGGTAAESAAMFTLGAAEGLSRAVSMGAEKMRAPTLYSYGAQAIPYGIAQQVVGAKMPEEGTITDPDPYEWLANKIWDWKNDVTQKFDIDPEFKKSLAGMAVAGVGSLLPQAAVSFLGPEATVAAIGGSAFSEATDRYWNEKGITPQDATPEQKREAFKAGIVYAIPSAIWNKVGLEGVMKSIFKEGVKALTPREFAIELGKRAASGAGAEAPTELADAIWGDLSAKVMYAPDTEMFTAESVKGYANQTLAAVISGGGFGAGGYSAKQGIGAIRNRLGRSATVAGEEVPVPVEVAQMPAQGEESATAQEAPITQKEQPSTPAQEANAGAEMTGQVDTGLGVMWKPEGETPGVTKQDIEILAKQNTDENGRVNEDAIRDLCENENVAEILVDAVKGDDMARKEYNMLLAEEAVKPTPELTEAEMDEIRRELDMVADDAPVEDVSESAYRPSEKELAEVEEMIYGALNDSGREDGVSSLTLREQAKVLAKETTTPEWEILLANRGAKALGLGKLSKKKERELLLKAKASDKALIEKIFGKLSVGKVRAEARERISTAITKTREEWKARSSEMRQSLSEKHSAEKKAIRDKLNASRKEAIGKLVAKIAAVRSKYISERIAANSERARKALVGRVQKKAKAIEAAIASAESGKKRLPYLNGDALKQYLAENYAAPSTAVMREFEAIQQRLASGEITEPSPADQNIIVEVTRPRIGDKDLSPRQAATFWADLNSLIRTGRTLKQARDEQRLAALSIETGAIKSDIEANNKRLKLKPRSALAQAGVLAAMRDADSRAKRFGLGLLKAETVGSILTGKEGTSAITTSITERLRAAALAEHDMNETAVSEIRNIAANSGLEMSKMDNYLVDGNGKRFERNGVNVRWAQAAAIYAYSKSEGGRLDLFGSTDDKGVTHGGTVIGEKNGAPHIATQADVDAIVKQMPASLVSFVDGVVEYLSTSEYDRINGQWYRGRFGVDMPKLENYFPIRNLSHPGGAILDMMENASKGGMARGFSKARTDSVAGFTSFDFIDTLVKHLAQVNHVVAYDQTLSDISTILEMNKSGSETARLMNARHPDLYRWFSKYLDDMRRGTTEQAKNRFESMVASLRSNSIKAILGYRPTSGLKVFSSFGPGARFIRPAFLFDQLYRTPIQRNEAIQFMLGNTASAEVKSRHGSIDKLMRDLSTDNNKWREMLEDKFDVNQFDGWIFMRIAEINQTAVLWNAKYNEVLADTGDKSQAVAKADWVIENTQQSGQLMNLSEWQRGGVLIRSIMPFKNDVINEFNSLVRILVANGTKAEKAKRLVSYAVYDMAWPAMVLSSAQALDKVLKLGVVTLAAGAGLVPPPDDKNSREKRTTIEQMRDDFVRFGLLQPISAVPFVDKVVEAAIVEAEAKLLPYGKEGARPPKVTQQPNIFDQPIYAVSTGKFAYATGVALGIPLTPYWAPLFDMKDKKEKQSNVPEY